VLGVAFRHEEMTGRGFVPSAARRPCIDLAAKAPSLTVLERTVNGQPGLIAQLDSVAVAVLAFHIAGDRIKHIWAGSKPRQAPAPDHGLTRVSMASGPLPAAAQPSLPSQPGRTTTGPPEKGVSVQPESQPDT
jgi:hypothetical protein